tara:strand:- start:6570 stop:7058 length:489 start_codon:yes stop_codon:yes gene_type:complete
MYNSDLSVIQINTPVEFKFLYAYILITTAIQPEIDIDFKFSYSCDDFMQKLPTETFTIITSTISFKCKHREELLMEIQKNEIDEVYQYISNHKLNEEQVKEYITLILLCKLYHVLVILNELKPLTKIEPLTINTQGSKHWAAPEYNEGRLLWSKIHLNEETL